ncbi:MAG: hypothetical protein QM767_29310 [Anaeromyxobacter sp.]
MAAFTLDKWYLDGVSAGGRAVIAYAARLRLGPLALGYTGLLDAAPGQPARYRSALRRFQAPALREGRLRFTAGALGFRAELAPRDPAGSATFLDAAEGAVTWSCQVPRGAGLFTVGDDRFEALGYAEHVRLTLPPWRLPIHTLRWGRILTATGSLAWVDWAGEGHQARLALRDGRPAPLGEVSEARVTGAGGEPLGTLGEGRVLRSGWLSRTVGPGLPAALREALPGRALRLHETKWCSPARLCDGSEGWAIHEVVTWR